MRYLIPIFLLAALSSASSPEHVQCDITDPSLQLPDFSHAGYAYGEKGIPPASGRVFDVTDFGAIPNDDDCDRQAIISTIRAAERHGGGIVFFPKGRFLISETEGSRDGIEINHSNIVLKGSGSAEDGTVLFMRHHLLPKDPEKMWTTPYAITFTPPGAVVSSWEVKNSYGGPATEVLEPAKTGDKALIVSHSEGFEAGMTISLVAENKALADQFTPGMAYREKWGRFHERGITVSEKHKISSIDGTKLILRAPLLTDIDPALEWSVIAYPMLENCGFEDITFQGNFHEVFVHHKNAIHDSGWSSVLMQNCHNSWVRRCRFVDVSSPARLNGCLASSILLCGVEGNMGHDSFKITFSTNCLTGLVRDTAPMFHGPGASHLSAGSVIWRIHAPDSDGIDFHGTYPRVSLVDASVSGGFHKAGASFRDFPQHLDGAVFWNYQFSRQRAEPMKFWQLFAEEPDTNYPDDGSLTIANPLIVGGANSRTRIDPDYPGRILHQTKRVAPESLYEAQLKMRLGYLPAWIAECRDEWEN